MKKVRILLILIFAILSIFLIDNKCYADLDRITNYVVTVDPRMNDGSLDITYEIEWRVLDSITEGPLTWVKIGTPNSNFDSPTALSSNIKKITPYSGSYVRIDFNRAYKAGETVKFKYSIHQKSMHKVSWGKCKYEFTPAWFTDSRIDKLIVRWNKSEVKSSNSKKTEDNYLVWTKTNMSKGEKLTIKVKYDKDAFGYLSTYSEGQNNRFNFIIMIFVIIIIVSVVISITRWTEEEEATTGHRGFYGGYRSYGGCVHSSCACASSCASSCACACAGSGRAGCSKKDFYGTNLTSEKIRKTMKGS